ncbi:MAG: hypothetical protein R6T90_02440 [Dissulfuribacterales bacterium]
MATPAKIDQCELDRLLKDNKTTSEIARHFGCTPGAVSQAKRKLNISLAVNTTVKEAPALVEKKQTAMDRLLDLASKCEAQLAWIEQTVTPSNSDEYRAWQDQVIKFAAETRKLFSAMAHIRTTIYQVEVVEKALTIMYEEIGREAPECQKRIRAGLQRARIPFQLDN